MSLKEHLYELLPGASVVAHGRAAAVEVVVGDQQVLGVTKQQHHLQRITTHRVRNYMLGSEKRCTFRNTSTI